MKVGNCFYTPSISVDNFKPVKKFFNS